MASIQELNEAQKKILDQLFFLDENDEEDAEQIELLKFELNKIHGDAKNTVLFLHKIWLECRDIASKRKEAKHRAEKRQKTADNAEIRLKTRLIEIMNEFGTEKVIDDYSGEGIRTQMSQGRLVYSDDFDINKLPDELTETIPLKIVPIDAKVKQAIKDGVEIEGAMIVKENGIRSA